MVIMNIGGSLHDKIYKLTLSDDPVIVGPKCYWDKSGNNDFPYSKVNAKKKYFAIRDSGYTRFAFVNESDARLFLDGANEFRDFCINWLSK